MKHLHKLFFIAIFFQCTTLYADQQHTIDSLNTILTTAQNDAQKADLLYQLSDACMFFNPIQAEHYAKEGVRIAEKTGSKSLILKSYYALHTVFMYKGKYTEALEYGKKTMTLAEKSNNDTLKALLLTNFSAIYNNLNNMPEAQKNVYAAIKLAEKIKFDKALRIASNNLGSIYQGQGRNDEAMKQFYIALAIEQKNKSIIYLGGIYHNMAIVFYYEEQFDSCFIYANKALEINKKIENRLWESYNYNLLGVLANTEGKSKEALLYLQSALELTKQMEDKAMQCTAMLNIGDTYFQMKDYVNSKKYTEESIRIATKANENYALEDAYSNLSDADTAQGKWESAYRNLSLSKSYHDTIVNAENTKKLVQSSMQFEFEKKESLIKAQQDKKDALAYSELQKQRIIKNTTFGGFAIVLLFALISYKRFTEKRKANILLEQALENLKSAQAQLVQSKEMAAFGTMASRVAHEIQNPLNFVTNFSELSEELLQDIINSTDATERNEVAAQLSANLKIINTHSKRADGIIKELQNHTRAGTAHEFFEE